VSAGARSPSARGQSARLRPSPLSLALAGSLALHGLAFISLAVLGGGARAGGERGVLGAGGDTIEIAVARVAPATAEAGTVAPRAPAPDSGERSVDAPREPEPSAAVLAVMPSPRAEAPTEPRVQARPERRAGPRRERASGAAPAEATAAEAGEAAGADAAANAPSAGDDDATNRGLAAGADAAALILGGVGLGDDTRARGLLERAIRCDDPIAGTWVSYRYSPEFHDWARFTLRIEREGETLRGTITARMWSGRASDRRPPPCVAGGFDVTVRMLARGMIRDQRFSFRADTYEILRIDCPSPFFAYNPDHFSGTVDPARDELDTVNNDGGRDVNAPYRFRRTGCRADAP
jgi:hypothetical protein